MGTKLTVVASAGMEELNFRSLERICRAQAALTTHEPTKRSSWKRWQRNIGARPISKIASRPRNNDNGAQGFGLAATN